jgi:hypothetical protein
VPRLRARYPYFLKKSNVWGRTQTRASHQCARDTRLGRRSRAGPREPEPPLRAAPFPPKQKKKRKEKKRKEKKREGEKRKGISARERAQPTAGRQAGPGSYQPSKHALRLRPSGIYLGCPRRPSVRAAISLSRPGRHSRPTSLAFHIAVHHFPAFGRALPSTWSVSPLLQGPLAKEARRGARCPLTTAHLVSKIELFYKLL